MDFKLPSPEMEPLKRQVPAQELLPCYLRDQLQKWQVQFWSFFLVISVTSPRNGGKDENVNIKVPSPEMEPLNRQVPAPELLPCHLHHQMEMIPYFS